MKPSWGTISAVAVAVISILAIVFTVGVTRGELSENGRNISRVEKVQDDQAGDMKEVRRLIQAIDKREAESRAVLLSVKQGIADTNARLQRIEDKMDERD